MKIIFSVLCLALTACASTGGRVPAALDRPLLEAKVPTALDLFLFGRFAVKAPRGGFLEENHYGQELDLQERRPVVNLAETVFALRYAKPGFDLFANFYHNGKFYIVNVPVNSVKDYYFQLSYFHYGLGFVEKLAPAAHSLLRFEMEKPIELVAEMPSLPEWKKLSKLLPEQIAARLPAPLSGEQNLIFNAALSAEAQWTKKDAKKSYDLFRGQRCAFIQIVRFVSMEVRLNEFFVGGNPVEQYLMEGPAADGSKVLAKGLEMSQSDGLRRIYDTTQFNCTTRAFDMVEEGLNIKDNRIGIIRDHASKHLPFLAMTKVAEFNGKELVVVPLWNDKSLVNESYNSWQRVVGSTGRDLCPATMSYREKNCPNLEAAMATLRDAGKIK